MALRFQAAAEVGVQAAAAGLLPAVLLRRGLMVGEVGAVTGSVVVGGREELSAPPAIDLDQNPAHSVLIAKRPGQLTTKRWVFAV